MSATVVLHAHADDAPIRVGSAARHAWVTFLDADHIWHADTEVESLELALAALREAAMAVAVRLAEVAKVPATPPAGAPREAGNRHPAGVDSHRLTPLRARDGRRFYADLAECAMSVVQVDQNRWTIVVANRDGGRMEVGEFAVHTAAEQAMSRLALHGTDR